MYSMDELTSKKLLTREEAAFYLGVCLASLNKVIHKPDFPALVRIGVRRVLINREKLDEWITKNTQS